MLLADLPKGKQHRFRHGESAHAPAIDWGWQVRALHIEAVLVPAGRHSSCVGTHSSPPTLETAAQVAHLAFP